MWKYSRIVALFFMLSSAIAGRAQEFFNLTADEVRIDTLLPVFTYSKMLGPDYADSTYEVRILYPEFIPMSEYDVKKYRHITANRPLPAMPVVSSYVAVDRKQGVLDASFVPLVCQGGKYKKLASFKIEVIATAKRRQAKLVKAGQQTVRYADNSVLSGGGWAKIRVPATGVYEITDALIRKAGFSSLNRIRVYGYGGHRQPETLTAGYLADTDDLKEVPLCNVGGRRLFFAKGPVYFNGTPNGAAVSNRIRNTYSDYGYYFITESDAEPLTVSSEELLAGAAASGYYNNVLYETDDYAWYQGGRNLFNSQLITAASPLAHTFNMPKPAGMKDNAETLTIEIAISADAASVAEVLLNGETLCDISTNTPPQYSSASVAVKTVSVDTKEEQLDFTINHKSGGNIRLDYIWVYRPTAMPVADLAADKLPVPEYVYRITNQNHHADKAVDMVIIIPTSQKLLAQAERIKALHEHRDGMTVRIVPADELFNEFSSGTPDATAYRRYMKMLYDRAADVDDAPKYLLLFGDCAWDNRMNSPAWRYSSPDDYLLSYQSENSVSSTENYVTDDFFALLDDGEAIELPVSSSSSRFTGKLDVAVGRIPARNADEAKTAVDKIEAYMSNSNPGEWQNTIVIMGDDGDSNNHMKQAENIAEYIESTHPAYDVKRIMWDAYTMEASSTGNSYPEVTKLIKGYLANGALIMNYTGHGAAYTLSHEKVVNANDFSTTPTKHLPLWVTASCDIMPYDGTEDNFGEGALFNKSGGAVAFFGAARTVYSTQNQYINYNFMREVLSTEGGRTAIGEAVRRSKNSLVDEPSANTSPLDATQNKLQYALLGDPALCLSIPLLKAVVDNIDGKPAAGGTQVLKAGSVVKIGGHIEQDGAIRTDFNGLATAVVQDVRQEVVCNLNPSAISKDGDDTPFTFYMRPNNIFKGTDNVKDGKFSLTFAVPRDINYSDETGRILLYAVSNDSQLTASGYNETVTFNGTVTAQTDSVGPSVFCYLNKESFVNGDVVNVTPYFVAQLYDEDGVNVSGSGIGHNLQLVIDGDMQRTYNLNDYFTYDFGSYQSGTVGFSIPALEPGDHTLLFRAWDVINNPSVTRLAFRVEQGARPQLVDISCTRNPATTSTQFRIVSDRINSAMDVVIDVFDISGRHLWSHAETGVYDSNAILVDWDLSMSGGGRLSTGVYLYRVRVRADGSSYATKAKKLVIFNNKS